MKRVVFVSFLLLLTACIAGSPQAEEGVVALKPCHLTGGLAAQCGVLTVPENRALDNGRSLDLHIAVLPVTGSITEPDPLFMLAGGPGQSAIETFPLAASLLSDLNESRDIVLVDQRGTGSSNPLTCPELEDETLDVIPDNAEVVHLLQQCAAEISQTTDLTQYTTDMAMTDLDEVRAALGYEQINLYGASYGTRAALAYARLFPERVRSLVLDSIVGSELVIFEQMPLDGQCALEMFFARCASDAACQEQFPNLANDYAELLTKLDQPREMSITHPLSGAEIQLTLTRDLFTRYIFNILYSTDLVTLLPLLIHEANEADDFEPLVAQAFLVSGGSELNTALLYTVTCAEDAPLIDLAQAEALGAESDFGLWVTDFLAICEAWPETAVAPDFRDSTTSDIPALLLSGDADPVTPPSYGAPVAAAFPNSQHLIVPHFGHGLLTVGCVSDLMTAFVEDGTAVGLDTSCLDSIQPPPFFVDFAGPES